MSPLLSRETAGLLGGLDREQLRLGKLGARSGGRVREHDRPVLELERVAEGAVGRSGNAQAPPGVGVEAGGEIAGSEQERVGQLPGRAAVTADRAAVVQEQGQRASLPG